MAGFGGWVCLVALLALEMRAAPPTMIESSRFRDGFEKGEAVWRQVEPEEGCRIGFQCSQSKVYREGTRGLQLRIETTASPGKYRLEYPIDPGQGIEDLTVRSWVKANRQGVTLGVRIVLPHQTDPTTGESMFFVIDGESNTEEGVWQQLKCVVSGTVAV